MAGSVGSVKTGGAVTDSRETRDLEAAVTTAMLRVFDKVQRNRRLDRDYGTGDQLSMVEAEVCQLIAATGEISPSDLADRIGVSRSAVSQALNRMRRARPRHRGTRPRQREGPHRARRPKPAPSSQTV